MPGWPWKGALKMNDKLSVLFVDDDEQFRKAIVRIFEASGFDITTAKDGQEALDLLSESKYNLIITDLKMPGLDGYELMREIKRREIIIPVIILTGYGEVETYMDLMNMGVYDHIEKPVSGRDLIDLARKAIGA
jgi:DNA-binding NtrC family response regulator